MRSPDEASQKAETKAIWLRGLYILLFFVICYLVAFVGFFVVVFQFIANLISKKSNAQLLQLGESLSLYAYDIIQFITFNSDDMPFPFKPWQTQKMTVETAPRTERSKKH